MDTRLAAARGSAGWCTQRGSGTVGASTARSARGDEGRGGTTRLRQRFLIVRAMRPSRRTDDRSLGTGGRAMERIRCSAAGARVGCGRGSQVLGVRAGEGDVRVRRGTRAEAFVKGPLCAEVDGFSPHAGVRVEDGDRRRLEHLCRYAGRPAIAASPLSLLPDGRVAYEPKRRRGGARRNPRAELLRRALPRP